MQLQMRAQFTPIAKDWDKRGRKAAAVALTRTAWKVRDGLMEGMKDDFDRPTPFTMRAFRVDMANASNLEATVYAAPLQARYLFFQIEGGERNTKGFERKMHLFGGQVAIPAAGAKLNQYGNMSLSFIRKVASDENTNGTAKRFFIGTPKGWLDDGTFDGVWARVDDNHNLVRVMSFAEDAQYKKRFDMSAIAEQRVNAVWESQLVRALTEYANR